MDCGLECGNRFVVCVFDLITFILFYRLVVRELESEGESREENPRGAIKRQVQVAAYLASFFVLLSWVDPVCALLVSAVDVFLVNKSSFGRSLGGFWNGCGVGCFIGYLLQKKFKGRGWTQGRLNLWVWLLILFTSLLLWMCFLFLGLLSKPTSDGEMSMLERAKMDMGEFTRRVEVPRSMVDSDGDATIFRIDSDVLRFEEKTLQLNGYKVANLPSGIDKIVIEKKGSRLEIFADRKALLSWSKSADGETRLEVSDEYSLVGKSPFGAELKALLGEFEEDVDLPKLIDIDGAAVRLYRFSKESFSSEESFFDFLSEKGVDFFVEKLGKQWGIVFPKETPLKLARIPAVDWPQVEPSQVSDYLSDSDFALDGHENGPFKGLYLPFSEGDPVYLAFRTDAGTEGVMEVTESSEVEGLRFQFRYLPREELSEVK